jgi:hypothetical protein
MVSPGSWSNFLYVFKAARNGPLTPPPGRASVASWRTRRPRRQPVGWRAEADRAAATKGCAVVGRLPTGGLGDAARGEPRRDAGRVAAVERRGWRRECAGPLLQAQGRFASQATALRAALDLGASATLGQESWAGRWPALTGCAPPAPPPDSPRLLRRKCVKASLTPDVYFPVAPGQRRTVASMCPA